MSKHAVVRLFEIYRQPLLEVFKKYACAHEVGAGHTSAQHTEEHATIDMEEYHMFCDKTAIVPELINHDTASAFFCEAHLLLETSTSEHVGGGCSFAEWLATLDMVATSAYAKQEGESEREAVVSLLKHLGIWDPLREALTDKRDQIEDHLNMKGRPTVPMDSLLEVQAGVVGREPSLLPDVCSPPTCPKGQEHKLPKDTVSMLDAAEASLARIDFPSERTSAAKAAIEAFIDAARYNSAIRVHNS